MDIQKQIDALFSDYQESPALDDFKEELTGHLDERVKSLTKKGMDEKSAIEKALGELGDISQVADEISKKKRQEVFSEMYMKTRNYMSAKRSALYALCGLVLGLAVLIPLITWFASGILVGAVSVLLPFGMAGVLGLLFLGLTQETASREAMSWKRALWYMLVAGLVLFGVLAAFITYFGMEFAALTEAELAAHGAWGNPFVTGAISVAMMFTLPGIALGIFLILTEKDHSKPWVIKQREEHMKYANEQFDNPAQAQKFGLICGALWIAAIAGFVLLTMLVGIKFSWLAIVAALVIQMIVMAAFTKSK